MTEKQRTLATVIEHFMDKAEKCRKSGNPQELIGADSWDSAAIEVAGLGASPRTIGDGVKRYMSRVSFVFDVDNMCHAVEMAKKGAPIEIVEDLIKFLAKRHCSIWALKDLTACIGREPAREEIFALVELERNNSITLSEDFHKKLVAFAGEYLSKEDMVQVKSMLRAKIAEWKSHPFD